MMATNEIIQILRELEGVGRSALSLENKNTIENLYSEVLDKVFTPTPCNDCYHDAVIEMLCYLRKYGQCKEKSMYRLKNGALLQNGFGSSEFYVVDTLTDDKAREFLRKDPTLINLFASYPDNWEEDIKESAVNGAETALQGDETSTAVNATKKVRNYRRIKK